MPRLERRRRRAGLPGRGGCAGACGGRREQMGVERAAGAGVRGRAGASPFPAATRPN